MLNTSKRIIIYLIDITGHDEPRHDVPGSPDVLRVQHDDEPGRAHGHDEWGQHGADAAAAARAVHDAGPAEQDAAQPGPPADLAAARGHAAGRHDGRHAGHAEPGHAGDAGAADAGAGDAGRDDDATEDGAAGDDGAAAAAADGSPQGSTHLKLKLFTVYIFCFSETFLNEVILAKKKPQH